MHNSICLIKSRIFNFSLSIAFGLLLSAKLSAQLCYGENDDWIDANKPIRGDVLILVNDNSVDSCNVGLHYAQQRNVPKENITHIFVPTTKLIDWPNFRSMMDQIIDQLLVHVEPTAPSAPICDINSTNAELIPTDGSPYYCQAVMDHIRYNTTIRYIVSTKGIPTKVLMPYSGLDDPLEAAGVDNQMKYWLLRFFEDSDGMNGSDNIQLNFIEREFAFGDGRHMREVNVANDGEFIFGRIDGYNLEASKRLVDRAILTEQNGVYGIHYGDIYDGSSSDSRIGLHWREYTDENNPNTTRHVYESLAVAKPDERAWPYQLGIFGESRPDCKDPSYPMGALPPPSDCTGDCKPQAPEYCLVRFSSDTAGSSDNTSVPGESTSQTIRAVDALSWYGYRDASHSGGNGRFETIKNTVKNASCTIKLCREYEEGSPERDLCEINSTDALGELNTDCVGVADGFFGFQVRSYSMTHDWVWPTGWSAFSKDSTKNYFHPFVKNDDSASSSDSNSLWFADNDKTSTAKCYVGDSGLIADMDTNFDQPPSQDCYSKSALKMGQRVEFSSPVQADISVPKKYDLSFFYKYDNDIDGDAGSAALTIRVQIKNNGTKVGSNFSAGSLTLNEVGQWTSSSPVQLIVPPPNFDAGPSVEFDELEIEILSGGSFVGSLGFDDISLLENGTPDELLKNTGFSGGHESVAAGDHAAVYLSRLNGLAFWGSFTHYQAGGASFADNALETMIYFYRGLPLGDAVWWGENDNGGMFYGDPLYSPIDVSIHYISDEHDYLSANYQLRADVINGRSAAAMANTSWSLQYCAGIDFFICGDAWSETGLSSVNTGTVNSGMDISLGQWNWGADSNVQPGEYVLRLKVTSTHPGDPSKVQSFYDYYPVELLDPLLDADQDGLLNGDELDNHGTNPDLADSDADGLDDSFEVAIGTDPAVFSSDTDLDGMVDEWEQMHGTDPFFADGREDLDDDGVVNAVEFLRATLPDDSTSKPEIKTIYVDPINNSSSDTFATIDEAMSEAEHGDTIQLSAGIHEFNSKFTSSRKSVRLQGAANLSSTISATDVFNFGGPQSDNVYWGEFTGVKLEAPVLRAGHAKNYVVSNNEVILSNSFHLANSNSLEILNNVIRASTQDSGTGIRLFNSKRALIENNTIVSFSKGIEAPSSTQLASGWLIQNNIMYGNGTDLDGFSDAAGIQYNLISDGTFEGQNDNISYDSATDDPLFIDAASTDYRLDSPLSPAIDSGNILSDCNVEPAPNGGRINLGAYGNTNTAALSSSVVKCPISNFEAGFNDASALGEDDSGYGNDGVLDDVTYDPDGVFGGAAKFSGPNWGQSIKVSGHPALHNNTNFTFSGWMKFDELSVGHQRLIDLPGSIIRTSDSNKFTFMVRDKENVWPWIVLSPDAAVINQWYHIAGTFEKKGSEYVAKLYIDGELVGSQSRSNTPDIPTSGDLYIGRANTRASIDEVKYFDRALSDGEISHLALEPYQHGHWRFNEVVEVADVNDCAEVGLLDDCAIDESLYENHGRLASSAGGNPPTREPLGFDGQSIKVESTWNSLVQVFSPDNLQGHDVYSIVAWISPDTQGTVSSQMIASQGGSAGGGFVFDINSDGRLGLLQSDGSSWQYVRASVEDSAPLFDDNGFHMVAVTVDTDSNVKLYLDGNEIHSALLNNPAVGATSANFRIGNGITDAYLDEVQFYSKALSEEELDRIIQEVEQN